MGAALSADVDAPTERGHFRRPDGLSSTGHNLRTPGSQGGNPRRTIDFHEGEKINEKALKTLIRVAATLNEPTDKS